jgi:hypothetical protein
LAFQFFFILHCSYRELEGESIKDKTVKIVFSLCSMVVTMALSEVTSMAHLVVVHLQSRVVVAEGPGMDIAAADDLQPTLTAGAEASAIDTFDVHEVIAQLFPASDAAVRKAVFRTYFDLMERPLNSKGADVTAADEGASRVAGVLSSSVQTPTPPAREPTEIVEALAAGSVSADGGVNTSTFLNGTAASSISFLCAGAAAGLIAKQTSDLAQELMHSSLRLKSPLHDEDPRYQSQMSPQSAEGLDTLPPILIVVHNRCPSDMLPWFSPLPLRPSQAQMSPVATAAWTLYETTERSLSKGRSGSEWTDAVSLFEQAAALFDQGAGLLPSSLEGVIMAGNCYVRAADCLRCLRDVDQMASCLERAGLAYLMASPSRKRRWQQAGIKNDRTRGCCQEFHPQSDGQPAPDVAFHPRTS